MARARPKNQKLESMFDKEVLDVMWAQFVEADKDNSGELEKKT